MITINGGMFKSFREDNLISRSTVAKESGLGVKVLAKLEGGGSVRLESVRRILDALGLSVDEAKRKGLIATAPGRKGRAT
jgi:transcriptional regulator with XRE-family HTH domain